MALARSNRLLPVLGSIVLLMTVFVGFKSCSSDNRHSPGFSPRASDTLAPDADTPADTIRTLTARVTDMTAQLEALREENAALRKRDRELRQSLKQEITQDLQASQTNSTDGRNRQPHGSAARSFDSPIQPGDRSQPPGQDRQISRHRGITSYRTR